MASRRASVGVILQRGLLIITASIRDIGLNLLRVRSADGLQVGRVLLRTTFELLAESQADWIGDLDIPHNRKETCGGQRNDDIAQGKEGEQECGLRDEHFGVG